MSLRKKVSSPAASIESGDLPTVLVDPREGSKLLIPYLENTCRVKSIVLEAADFAWKSNGPVGKLFTGVEYKTIQDFVTSKRDNRLLTQVVGMLEIYDRNVILIEGDWGLGQRGMLVWRGKEWRDRRGNLHQGGYQEPRLGDSRPLTYGEVSGYIWALQFIAGFEIWRSMEKEESAVIVAQAARLEQMEYESHKSLGVGGVIGMKVGKYKPTVKGRRFAKPSRTYRFAAQIDGLGDLASKTHDVFATPWDMVNATVEEWEAVLPKKDKWRAERVWKWLRERG